jgi:hypothetical protein
MERSVSSATQLEATAAARHAAEVDALDAQHRAAQSEAEALHQQRARALAEEACAATRDAEGKVRALEDRIATAAAAHDVKLQHQVDRTSATEAAALETLRERHAAALRRAESDAAASRTALQQRLHAAALEVASYESALALAEVHHAGDMRLHEALASASANVAAQTLAAHEDALAQLRTTYHDAVAQHGKAEAEEASRHNAAIADLRQTWASELSSAGAAHKERVDALTVRLAATERAAAEQSAADRTAAAAQTEADAALRGEAQRGAEELRSELERSARSTAELRVIVAGERAAQQRTSALHVSSTSEVIREHERKLELMQREWSSREATATREREARELTSIAAQHEAAEEVARLNALLCTASAEFTAQSEELASLGGEALLVTSKLHSTEGELEKMRQADVSREEQRRGRSTALRVELSTHSVEDALAKNAQAIALLEAARDMSGRMPSWSGGGAATTRVEPMLAARGGGSLKELRLQQALVLQAADAI